jgi:Ser/Thr protein kinase RdoA (MazF antagonist)
MSTEFFSLSPERVLEAVELFGFECTGRVLALNSLENRVYEVQTEDKEHPFVVVKFYRPNRWTKDQILEEHKFLLELAREEIPVVAPLLTDNGESILDSNGIICAVFPKKGGRLESEYNQDELKWLGRVIARIHQVGARDKFRFRPKVSYEWYALHNKDSVLTYMPKELLPGYEQVLQIARVEGEKLSSYPSLRIHGDLHRGNILWRDGPLVVDFDDSLMGPRVQDLWLLIPGRDAEARRIQEKLLEGYNQIASFPEHELFSAETLRLLRMIQYTGWVAKRWEDPSFKRAFPEFSEPDFWHKHLVDLREQCSLLI